MFNLPNKNKILNNFFNCVSWEEKYIFLIELGKYLKKNKLLKIKNDKNLIYGCQNLVWIKLYKKNNLFYFYGDSESLIVKGLLVLIFIFFNGLKAKTILALNIKSFLKEIKIDKNLTLSRLNGLENILQNIKKLTINNMINSKLD